MARSVKLSKNTIKESKLNLFGHICIKNGRYSRLVFFGKGGSVRGDGRENKKRKTKREWPDDIKKWCNEDI